MGRTPDPDRGNCAKNDEDIGAVPVGENDRLVGVVPDCDIVTRGIASARNCMELVAKDVMTKPIVYARSDEDVEGALHIMVKNQIRRLPVIDEDGRMTGILSLGDICEKAGRDLVARGDDPPDPTARRYRRWLL